MSIAITERIADKIETIRDTLADLPLVAELDDQHLAGLLASNENSPRRVCKLLKEGAAAGAASVAAAAADVPSEQTPVAAAVAAQLPEAPAVDPREPQRKEGKAVWPENVEFAEVPRSHIAAALKCASTKDIRYYLNGVLIEVTRCGKSYAVGTNGHMMGAFEAGNQQLPQYDLQQVIVPREACEAMLKRKGSAHVRIIRKGGEWLIIDGLGSMSFVPVDGLFPSWRRVLPTSASDVGMTCLRQFNADLMSVAADALRLHALKPKGLPVVRYAQPETDGAAAVMTMAPGASVVIMPLRGEALGEFAPIMKPADY